MEPADGKRPQVTKTQGKNKTFFNIICGISQFRQDMDFEPELGLLFYPKEYRIVARMRQTPKIVEKEL